MTHISMTSGSNEGTALWQCGFSASREGKREELRGGKTSSHAGIDRQPVCDISGAVRCDSVRESGGKVTLSGPTNARLPVRPTPLTLELQEWTQKGGSCPSRVKYTTQGQYFTKGLCALTGSKRRVLLHTRECNFHAKYLFSQCRYRWDTILSDFTCNFKSDWGVPIGATNAWHFCKDKQISIVLWRVGTFMYAFYVKTGKHLKVKSTDYCVIYHKELILSEDIDSNQQVAMDTLPKSTSTPCSHCLRWHAKIRRWCQW